MGLESNKPLHFMMLKEMASVTGVNPNYYRPFVDELNKTFAEFGLISDLDKVHFLAQGMHETGGFIFLKELGKNEYFKKYEFSQALGNTEPGDGPKFKGRGIFQVTGRFNYNRASMFFKEDFLNKPELLESIPWACRSAGWFWKSNRLGEMSAKNDFLSVTFRINGGFNGVVDRYNKFIIGLRVFGFTEEFINQFKKNLREEIILTITTGVNSTRKNRLKKAFPDEATVRKFIV